jgi:hypothetical protein
MVGDEPVVAAYCSLENVGFACDAHGGSSLQKQMP